MATKEVLFTPIDATTQSITTGATSVQSAVINASVVDITSIGYPSWVSFGANPTAIKPTSYYLVPDAPYRFPIYPGTKVAVIQDSVSTTLIIAPVTAYVQV